MSADFPLDIIPASPTCAHPDWSVDGDGNVGPGYGAGAAPPPAPKAAASGGKHKKKASDGA